MWAIMLPGTPAAGPDPLSAQGRFDWRLKEPDEPGLDNSDWPIQMRIDRLVAALAGSKDLDTRISIADRLIVRADAAWKGHWDAGLKRNRSESRRSVAGWLKAIAIGVAPLLAAGSGVALLAKVNGGLVTQSLGLLSVALGGVAAALNAIDTEAEVRRNRYKSREYERLWRDSWDYVLVGLPLDTVEEARKKLDQFSKQYSQIGLKAQDLSGTAAMGES